MLRIFVLLSAGIFGLYFFEQYSGITFGMSAVVHGLGGIVGEATGFTLFSGDVGGYGAASGAAGSIGGGVSGLGSGIGNNMRSIGGF